MRKSKALKQNYQALSNRMDLKRYRTSTQHSILHSMPLTHTKKHVPSGKRTSEKKPLQKSNPCTRSYSGIKKKLTDRTPTDLTKAEVKGRGNRPTTIPLIIVRPRRSYICSSFNCSPHHLSYQHRKKDYINHCIVIYIPVRR